MIKRIKRSLLLVAILGLTALFFACVGPETSNGNEVTSVLYQSANTPIPDRVNDLVSQMTLEEKVGQMTQVDRQFLVSENHIKKYFLGSLLSGGGSAPSVNTPESWADMTDGYQEKALETRLSIPLIYGIDAVHGHNNVYGATVFPHNIGLGATGDEDLIYRIAAATAEEVRATGIDWNFGPCITVPQDERWGRHYEGFGEEPQLVSRLGAAAITGYQGENLSDSTTILAGAKHFLADGGTEGGRDRGDAKISEEELRRIHLFPYYAAIEAGAGNVMASFSSWNGEQMHGNKYLLQDVLRGELGFDGFTVSDWAALTLLPGNYDQQVALGINAGIDMVMVPDDYIRFIQSMIRNVEDGNIPVERIDEAVSNILVKKFELGLFEDPFAPRDLLETVGSDAHRAIGREAVAKSQVLLKNEGSILPLSNDIKNLVVIGSLSDNIGAQCGGWTISWQGSSGDITPGTSVLDGIKELVGENTTIYTSLDDASGVDIDAIICVVGERPYAEMQGDNSKLELAFAHKNFIEEASNHSSGAPVITLLISGRPLMMTPQIEMSDAFIASWLPGTEGGGVADVLFGDYNPTGKLPVSWPRDISQVPVNVGDENYDPLYPFGFGLSY